MERPLAGIIITGFPGEPRGPVISAAYSIGGPTATGLGKNRQSRAQTLSTSPDQQSPRVLPTAGQPVISLTHRVGVTAIAVKQCRRKVSPQAIIGGVLWDQWAPWDLWDRGGVWFELSGDTATGHCIFSAATAGDVVNVAGSRRPEVSQWGRSAITSEPRRFW
jgi:hypothetical protein